MEVLAIVLIVLSLATSPIVTKAGRLDVKVPSFLYFHLPLYAVALCYGPNYLLSLLIFAIILLIFTAGAAIYVQLNDLW